MKSQYKTLNDNKLLEKLILSMYFIQFKCNKYSKMKINTLRIRYDPPPPSTSLHAFFPASLTWQLTLSLASARCLLYILSITSLPSRSSYIVSASQSILQTTTRSTKLNKVSSSTFQCPVWIVQFISTACRVKYKLQNFVFCTSHNQDLCL